MIKPGASGSGTSRPDAQPPQGRRLHIQVFGAARSGKSRLVAELAAASPLLLPFEGRLTSEGRLLVTPIDRAAPNPAASDPARPGLVLLTGLDLPASGIAPAEQARQDAGLREALQAAGLAWRVVYGLGPERLRNALQAVAEVAPWAWQASVSEAEAGRWQRLQASCEKCGDAACEHRLFTGLPRDGVA